MGWKNNFFDVQTEFWVGSSKKSLYFIIMTFLEKVIINLDSFFTLWELWFITVWTESSKLDYEYFRHWSEWISFIMSQNLANHSEGLRNRDTIQSECQKFYRKRCWNFQVLYKNPLISFFSLTFFENMFTNLLVEFHPKQPVHQEILT